MSLFPAYAQKDPELDDTEDQAMGVCVAPALSAAQESALLAGEGEGEEPQSPQPPSPAPAAAPPSAPYYVDRRLDRGNLPVSTLYYPGRPEYVAREARRAEGLRRGPGARAPRSARRYFARRAPAPAPALSALPALAEEAAARAAAFRRLLAAKPTDEALHLRHIDFQEWCGDEAGAVGACEAAAARLPRARAVRARLHAALRRALPAHDYLTRLRDLIAAEARASERVELWVRLLGALAGAAHGHAEALRAAAAHAVRDTRAHAPAYPRLLYVYGAFLRSGGLWEQLVLLVELVLAMSGAAPDDAFPPPQDKERDAAADADLAAYEHKTMSSGLPLSEVWARVERARGALHWRAPPLPPGHPELAADPQRAPAPSDAADLLLPIVHPHAAFLTHVALLRLAEVPLLPSAQYVLEAVGGGEEAAGWEAAGGAALLALVRAARRLPPAHAAHAPPPAAARALLAGTPLRAHTAAMPDPTGYGEWVSALWEACLRGAGGARRAALLCWRLRALHARLLLLGQDEAGRSEARRVRREAREALQRHAGGAALPFALFARVEALCGPPARAPHAALAALRAATQDPASPPHHALYIARVVSEVSEKGEQGAEARWALASAALRRPLPPAPEMAAPPPAALMKEALLECERRCEELERGFEEEEDEEEEGGEGAEGGLERACGALLPGAGEWACARALLAPPLRRAELAARALLREPRPGAGWSERRYLEQQACALVAAAARDHRAAHWARALAPRFPHNGYLALMGSGAPLWAWPAELPTEARLRALAPRSPAAALASALPALLRAEMQDYHPTEAERAVRAVRRAGRGGVGGAALAALLLHLEAHAPRPRTRQALTAALHEHPHCKLVYVLGATLCPAEGGALPDLLLERQLRAHALPDELHAPETPAPAP